MSPNVAASVRQRLRDLARQRREDFQFLLVRYGLERFLYRLSQSDAKERFVLKGAALFALWTDQPHRATRDIDLLARGDNSIPQMEQLFREICAAAVQDDGLVFVADSVRGQVISPGDEYEGLRMTLSARLEKAKIPLQVDIGFGDVITPGPTDVSYPVLLDFPPPRLAAYPKETVVAEKLQAIVALGMANSRMKDFFDLWTIARQFELDGELLARAVHATFARRKTPLPSEPPLALTTRFSSDPVKQAQWRAFAAKVRTGNAAAPPLLEEVIPWLAAFLLPLTRAAEEGAAGQVWPAGGPWSSRSAR